MEDFLLGFPFLLLADLERLLCRSKESSSIRVGLISMIVEGCVEKVFLLRSNVSVAFFVWLVVQRAKKFPLSTFKAQGGRPMQLRICRNKGCPPHSLNTISPATIAIKMPPKYDSHVAIPCRREWFSFSWLGISADDACGVFITTSGVCSLMIPTMSARTEIWSFTPTKSGSTFMNVSSELSASNANLLMKPSLFKGIV